MKALSCTVTSFALLVAACGSEGASQEFDSDSDSDSDSAISVRDLKGLGLVDGEEDARAVLAAANQLSEAVLIASTQSGGVQLTKVAAHNVVAHRVGVDVVNVVDDDPFDSLAELAAVPQVGKKSIQRLLDYARAHKGELLGPKLPQVAAAVGDAHFSTWIAPWYSSPGSCYPTFAGHDDKCDVTVERLGAVSEGVRLKVSWKLRQSGEGGSREFALDSAGKSAVREADPSLGIGWNSGYCAFGPGFESSIELTKESLNIAIHNAGGNYGSPSDPRTWNSDVSCRVSLPLGQ